MANKVIVILINILVCAAWAYPSTQYALPCKNTSCKIEDNCRCSSEINPINNASDPAPQLIALTLSESIVGEVYNNYLKPLFFNRVNPDGNKVSLTFYVNHEYTDYELVHKLYLQGHEIGVHSITKNSSQEYWRYASLNDLVEEFSGQRQIISTFANIPLKDIVGVRTPQLQIEGDLSIDAYVKSGLTYDNSWPTTSTAPLLPYTLEYKSTQKCLTTISCPEKVHEHFWIVPITNIKGKNNVECNSFVTCLEDGTAEEISNWLLNQVDRVYNGNRAPLVLRLDSYWFKFARNSFEGFTLFLNEISKRSDVYFVAVQEILEWIKHPVSASNFKRKVYERSADCKPITCNLIFLDGSNRFMQSCIPCPEYYPWKGNPLGN